MAVAHPSSGSSFQIPSKVHKIIRLPFCAGATKFDPIFQVHELKLCPNMFSLASAVSAADLVMHNPQISCLLGYPLPPRRSQDDYARSEESGLCKAHSSLLPPCDRGAWVFPLVFAFLSPHFIFIPALFSHAVSKKRGSSVTASQSTGPKLFLNHMNVTSNTGIPKHIPRETKSFANDEAFQARDMPQVNDVPVNLRWHPRSPNGHIFFPSVDQTLVCRCVVIPAVQDTLCCGELSVKQRQLKTFGNKNDLTLLPSKYHRGPEHMSKNEATNATTTGQESGNATESLGAFRLPKMCELFWRPLLVWQHKKFGKKAFRIHCVSSYLDAFFLEYVTKGRVSISVTEHNEAQYHAKAEWLCLPLC